MKIHDLAYPKPHISTSNFDEISMIFSRPLSGRHFASLFMNFVHKLQFFGGPWDPGGAKMIPKIVQMAPKRHPELFRVAPRRQL